MKVLSTGEKIRNLRKGIGLKQEDIVNNGITRSLISMIENNKRNLTYKTAKIIAHSLNAYYIHLGKEITPDLLLETENEQARRIILERLKELEPLLLKPTPGCEDQLEDSFQQLVKFALEWHLEEIISDLWERKGSFYRRIHRYNRAIQDYYRALEYFIKTSRFNKAAEIYNLVGNCYYCMALYEQALVYYHRVKDILEIHSIENHKQMEIYYGINTILCYRKLKHYDMVLRTIALYKDTVLTEGEYYDRLLLIEGNTYRDLGNYDKAIRVYEKLLKKRKKLSLSMQMLVNENYGELYQKLEDYEKSLYYLQHSYYCNLESEPNYGPSLCLTEAKSHFAIGKVDEAFQLVQKGIGLAEKFSSASLLRNLRFFRVKMLIDLGNYPEAETCLMEIEHSLNREQGPRSIIQVYVFYIDLYCRWEKKERCLSYAARLQGMEL